MNEKCRPDEYPPYEPQGALAKRLAKLNPKPVEDRRPAWLRNLTVAKDMTGAVAR